MSVPKPFQAKFLPLVHYNDHILGAWLPDRAYSIGSDVLLLHEDHAETCQKIESHILGGVDPNGKGKVKVVRV